MTIDQAVLGFAAVALLLTIVPGIDTTLVLRSTLVGGRRQAAAAALGITLGLFVWGAAAAVGAAALLAASEQAFRVVTLGGAAYIVYLGGRMLWRAVRGDDATVADAPPAARRGVGRALATGLTTNVLNPKIGVFYIATIPQFIPDGYAPLPVGLLLAAVHAALGLVWFALIILGAGYARRWLGSARGVRAVDAVAGTALVAMGVRLALAHR
ncbi:LysE family translocator [Demequina iriomotensis]|uniref:LysE family translocator n=1 Tax=Demequina iriomotensis TaxID=1536641 RepID=UPI000782A0A6|nr:LysE family translocator [Demequina iriomotensis]